MSDVADRYAVASEGLPTTGISREGAQLRVVTVRRNGGRIEIIRLQNIQSGESDWGILAAQVRTPDQRKHQAVKETIIVGFDSTQVIFYPLVLPEVSQEETAAMVRLQLEAQLPLPPADVEWTWHKGPMVDGKVHVIVAAARRQRLRDFAEQARCAEPEAILLGCEAVVKVWQSLFGGGDGSAIVMDMRTLNTQLCHVRTGMLLNAASVDMGTEHLAGCSDPGAAAERFGQDAAAVLRLFGSLDEKLAPVFLLSSGDSIADNVASVLRSHGYNVKAVTPDMEKMAAPESVGLREVFEYREAIGLALLGMEPASVRLDLFEHVYQSPRRHRPKRWYHSPRTAACIAAALILILAAIWYAVDVASLRTIEGLWGRGTAGDCEVLVERQKLVRTVAAQRPDILELLKEIQSSENQGIRLDSFHFKKGQPVSIGGRAQSTDALYKFHKSLRERKGFGDVKMPAAALDQQRGDYRFTISFQYRTFTKART